MSVPGRQAAAHEAPADALTRSGASGALDDVLVVEALAHLTGAVSAADACDAVLPLLLEVPGVRAAAVVARDGDRVLIVGSAGYGCGPMSPGAVLPLDAGLPVTEAVRTGRAVVQGQGPSWVALPYGGRAGALLLSMTTPPPQSPAKIARLQRITRGLGDALHRAQEQDDAVGHLAAVTARLTTPAAGLGATVRSLPHDGPVGGDVALCLPDGRGGRWLVVADVCGAGLAAAVVAHTVHATFTALAPYVDGPTALLCAADDVLRASVRDALFVTALVAHEHGGRLRVASAGHPPLLLLTPAGATVVEVEPGLPLALDSEQPPARSEAALDLPADAVLMLHSDGLLDRRVGATTQQADPVALVAGCARGDLEALADQVLAAADLVGEQSDDITLMLARAAG